MNGTAGRSGLVALGVIGSGLGTVAMLATGSRLFSVDHFAVFATWWVVATLVTFPLGVFETLLTRQVVTDLVARVPAGTATGAVAARAAVLVLPAAVLLGVLDPVLARHLFDGTHWLGPLLAVFLVSGLVQALERGYAAGVDRFSVVSTLLALDGATRAAALLVCALADVESPVAAAFAVATASVVTAVVGHLVLRGGWFDRATQRQTSFSTGAAALLLAGSLGPILINNASVPWLSSHHATAIVVGSFSGALALSRIPIQLSGAAFGPLLRRFAHAVETGDEVREQHEYRLALLIAVIVAGVFVAGFTALGELAISIFLGSRYGVPLWVYALLGSSSGAMMVAVVAQVRAVARERWRAVAYSWLLAAAGFAVTLLGPGSLLLRCALAPAVGTLVGLLSLAAAGRSRRVQPVTAR